MGHLSDIYRTSIEHLLNNNLRKYIGKLWVHLVYSCVSIVVNDDDGGAEKAKDRLKKSVFLSDS